MKRRKTHESTSSNKKIKTYLQNKYNISDICYEFIDNNKDLFYLSDINTDHSMNFKALHQYIGQQTCGQ